MVQGPDNLSRKALFAIYLLVFIAFFLPISGKFVERPLALAIAIALSLAILLFQKTAEELPEIVFASILSVLSIALLWNAGLFSGGTPDFADTSYHYYTSGKLWASLGSGMEITGWNPEFHFGYPSFYDLPPLFFLLAGLPNAIFPFISRELSFGAVSGATFLVAVLGIFLFSRRAIGIGKTAAFLASLFFIASRQHVFENGVFSAYLSMGLVFLAISALFKEGKICKGTGGFFLSASLFAFSLLSHPGIFAIGLLFFLTFLLGEELSFDQKRAIPLALASFILIAAPYFVEVLLGRTYSAPALSGMGGIFPSLFMQEEAFSELLNYPHLISLSILLAIAHIAGLALGGKKTDRLFNGVIAAILFSLASSLLQKRGFSIANIFVSERMAFFLFALLAIISAVAVERIILSSQTGFLGKTIALFPAILAIVLYSAYLLFSWHCPSCSGDYDRMNSRPFLNETGVFKNWYGERTPEAGIFSRMAPAQIRELSEFLSRKSSSRVFLESGPPGHYGMWVFPYLYETAGTEFSAGPQINLGGQIDTNSADGLLFGRKIGEYSPEELERTLTEANIGYLVVRAPSSKETLSGLHGIFRIERELPAFRGETLSIFKYENAPDNYAFPRENATTVKHSSGSREYAFHSTGEFTLSARYSENWVALQENGSEIGIEKDTRTGFARIKVPEGYAGPVRIEYSPPKESVLAGIALLMGLGIAIFGGLKK